MTISMPVIYYLQGSAAGGATANGAGTPANVPGYQRAIMVEFQETAGGTATVQFNGSFDGTTWYVVGHQLVSNTASPARSVTALSVTASLTGVIQLLDAYPQYQAVISSIAAATLMVRLYGVA